MARIVLVLDIDVSPSTDPLYVADEILPEEFIAFAPGRPFITDCGWHGTYVSAEWAPLSTKGTDS